MTVHTARVPLQLCTAGVLPVKVRLVVCRMIMAALQDPLNQFFIQLSGGMKDSTRLSSIHGVARPAALHRVCTLMGRAVKSKTLLISPSWCCSACSAAWGLHTAGQGSQAAGLPL